ncbi:MAG: DNA/RNA non-specific endonuclease, partial [Candidatus Riflebacteria bacterium]|nr:DNA/RNA non-specific endonuclease [Candidatus Riflebacteria bacterium]
ASHAAIPAPISSPVADLQPTPVSDSVPSATEPVSESVPVGESVEKSTHEAWDLVYAGFPRVIATESVYESLRNKAYAVGYSELRHDPLWVSYRLGHVDKAEILPRPSRFESDRRTKNIVYPQDYTKTGFDRGHMAPNSEIAVRYGQEAQEETFLMSNIVPQRPNLNRKVWEHLERLEDKYANAFGRVFVMDGPIFNPNAKRENLGNSEVEIPDKCYKIIVDAENGTCRMLAYMIPEDVIGIESPDEFLTSVDAIEAATSLDFFPALPSRTQDAIEAQVATASWPVY